jgi:hypothetical protein
MTIENSLCKPSLTKNGFYDVDPINGFIPCVIKTYNNTDQLLVVCTNNPKSSYKERSISFEVEEFFFSSSLNIWTKIDTGSFGMTNTFLLNDGQFINTSDGSLSSYIDATEDDLSKPFYGSDGTTILGYDKKLKSGYITEYEYYLNNVGKTIIFPGIYSAIRMKIN